ncbi:MAG: N-acetylglucosamine kinase, partial [Hyphomicrobiales bacterium]|nr:N-acetylglucosamine kinase [Hyphomicrobiales bacterium]MBV8664451.1 N-acetylglucosamine kinase [Hyphomicrobiales bacterium]
MQAKPDFFLGVDGGATRCRARLRDRTGALLGEVEGPAANIYVDFDGAIANAQVQMDGACAKAGLDRSALARTSLGLGLAGL